MRHFAESSNVAKPTFCRVHSILRCFRVQKCRVVGVWAVKTMFSDKPSWRLVQAYGLQSPYTHYFALSRTRKHCRVEWKRQKVVFATFNNSTKCLMKAKPALGLFKSTKMHALHRKIVYMSHQSFLLHCSRRT